MLWAILIITSTINQAAQIPMMMSQTMGHHAMGLGTCGEVFI
jgi:hypothetical protein